MAQPSSQFKSPLNIGQNNAHENKPVGVAQPVGGEGGVVEAIHFQQLSSASSAHIEVDVDIDSEKTALDSQQPVDLQSDTVERSHLEQLSLQTRSPLEIEQT